MTPEEIAREAIPWAREQRKRLADLIRAYGDERAREATEKSIDVLASEQTVERARARIEDILIDRRNRRIGVLCRGNGLVVRERDGGDSAVMRMPTREAITFAYETAVNAVREAAKEAK